MMYFIPRHLEHLFSMKSCCICPKQFEPFRTTDRVCSLKCDKKLKTQKANKKKKLKKELGKNVFKSFGKHEQDLQKEFNKYIRLRDAGKPCISCQKYINPLTAGHYIGVGANCTLRFNEFNVNGQCSFCNGFLSGNPEQYRIHLINKIGIDKVLWLEGPHEPNHYSVSALQKLTKVYRGINERLEKELSN